MPWATDDASDNLIPSELIGIVLRQCGAGAQVRSARRDVAGALVFFVAGKEAGRAIAEVGDFVADGLQAFDDAGGAEGGGSFFASRKKSGGAGRCSDDGNFVRLTNDLNRQGTLLVLRIIAWPLESGGYSGTAGYPWIAPGNFPGPAKLKNWTDAPRPELAARRGRDGLQLRRERETHVLADQV